MTSLLRTTTRAGVVTVLSVVGLASLGACSAVLGIGDWVDLTDGGSGVGDAGSDARNADDGQTGDATIADGSSKDARVDAALDHAAPSDAHDAATHDAGDAFPEADDGEDAVIVVSTASVDASVDASADASAASLDFNTGPNSNGGVGISCGKTGPTLELFVKNTGTGGAEITGLTLGLGLGSPYKVLPLPPIAIAAGETVPITVAPNAVLSSSPPAANLNDTLTVTTNANNDLPHVVSLMETSAGAALSLSPTDITFSLTPPGAEGIAQLSLANSGNIDAPVVFSSGGNPVFTFDTGVVAVKSANEFPNAYFRPTMAQTYTSTGGSMTVVADAGVPLCASFNGSISFSLSGTGTTSNTYAVAPASVPFGNNTCGATAPAAQTITITNSAVASTTWTATLSGSGSAFFKLSAGSGTVNGSGATDTFTVAPKALLSTSGLTAGEIQSGVSATLTIVVGTGATAETFTIPVSETPIGAFPMWSMNMISMTGSGSTGSVELQNAAMAPTSFTFTSSSTSFPVSPGKGSSSAGAPLTLTVTDNALLGSGTATVAVSLTTPSDPLCGPLPDALMVTGNGAL